MVITAANTAISPISVNQPTNTAGASSAAAGKSFGSFVKDAVDSVGESQNAASEELAKAVTGDSPDLHRTIIALQTADLQFQFAMQVRNKVIGAYEEIMRMQV